MAISKKKAGAAVALAVVAGAPFAPLIADELETPPAPVASEAGTSNIAVGRLRRMRRRLMVVRFILPRLMHVSA